ncbi:PREDICTED: protein FAM227A-like isoform X4 [Branchiostoma belcheri]|uniref:Protein FAM227A-like isoform X3 n=1 Tax=Branchiostoma belcheri TaxID=7741 RepID=A0A6P4ZYG5_BRABE|nr:PREDICTED: protein FAM227A-like isoform X3 [Branchiostoma belcheri]XP_019641978.1 PREDICTED: protein FAM227A-like isoform X4 [Branchiostoma belcheri]
MAAITRTASPMNLLEEDLLAPAGSVEQKHRALQKQQEVSAPFLIGSIQQVNERISHLEQEFQSYTHLVIESRLSGRDDDDSPDPLLMRSSSKLRRKVREREREKRQLDEFSSVYASRSSQMLPEVRSRRRPEPGIPKERSEKSDKSIEGKKERGEPRLVELQQYPGYDPNDLTPLPGDIPPEVILQRVTDAATDLNNKVPPKDADICLYKVLHKPNYKPEFCRLFFSRMSDSILLDTFWWFFLHRYMPDKTVQSKLFNRIAHNYVKLLMYADHPRYREVFLETYPDLLAQSVYSAFCACFPTSWQQFGDDFKAELTDLTWEWVAGIKPVPRSYLRWNLYDLEPPNMRKQVVKKGKNKKSALELDLPGDQQSGHSSSMSLSQQLSKLSVRGSPRRARSLSPAKHRSPTHGGRLAGATSMSSLASSSSPTLKPPQLKASSRSSVSSSVVDEEAGGQQDRTLTPIREDPTAPAASLTEMDRQMLNALAHEDFVRRKRQKESHPAGRGPDFAHAVFNIHGNSPLVARFLQQQNLEQRAGTNVLVRRTQVTRLPPMEAQTYSDVVKDGYKSVRQLEQGYSRLVEESNKEHSKFLRMQRRWLDQQQRKQASLLSNRKEVRRLCDLLMLEHHKDVDEVTSVGAAQAIEDSLMSQPC